MTFTLSKILLSPEHAENNSAHEIASNNIPNNFSRKIPLLPRNNSTYDASRKRGKPTLRGYTPR